MNKMDFLFLIQVSLASALFFCACLYLQKGSVKPVNDSWFVPVIVAMYWTSIK